jgi:hypothetical protein
MLWAPSLNAVRRSISPGAGRYRLPGSAWPHKGKAESKKARRKALPKRVGRRFVQGGRELFNLEVLHVFFEIDTGNIIT